MELLNPPVGGGGGGAEPPVIVKLDDPDLDDWYINSKVVLAKSNGLVFVEMYVGIDTPDLGASSVLTLPEGFEIDETIHPEGNGLQVLAFDISAGQSAVEPVWPNRYLYVAAQVGGETMITAYVTAEEVTAEYAERCAMFWYPAAS